MQPSCNIAFKEWSVVVDALGRGQQAVILRKGGIVEDKGAFRVDHDRFWLFPTLFHQQLESVTSGGQQDLDSIQAKYQPEGAVRIEFLVRAEKVIECYDLAKVKGLADQHIWKEKVIEDRFHYGRKNGIHAIVARVYRLPHPETLPMLSSYGGCKSWVELGRPLPTGNLVPVLGDAEFKARSEKIVAALL